MLISTMLSSAGCTIPIPNSCGWLNEIIPDPGFEQRWTHNEKQQVEAYDEKLDANCR